MSLYLSSNHLNRIKAHAEQTYPDECCGLLLGKLEPNSKVVADVRMLENTWEGQTAEEFSTDASFTKARRYWIAPEDMLVAMRDARQLNWDIIGIYHSHPDHPAVPSECDRRLAWQRYSYLIVSVEHGSANAVCCWQLNEQHQFQAEDMVQTEDIIIDRLNYRPSILNP